MTDKQENKLTFGIEQVHFAPLTVSATGEITYETPKRLPGARSIELDPQGTDIKLKADNINYYVSESNDGYTGKIKFYNLTPEFRQYALGEVLKGDYVIETAEAARKPFALLFQFEGDKHATRHALLYCTAKRPKDSSNTKDGNNYNEVELEFTASPRPSDKIVKVKTHKDTEQEKYDSFFKQVLTIPA